MNNEDITQDPEYIKGYEIGMQTYRDAHGLWGKGFNAGLHALETPEVVESKATPVQPEQTKRIQEQLEDHEMRIKKLEEYYGRHK